MPKHKPTKKADTSDSDSGPDDRVPEKKSKPTTAAKGAGDDSNEVSWDLGKNRMVKLTEFKGKWYVDIREFYMSNDGESKPGRKGIMLTMEQWQKFRGAIDGIDASIKRNI